MSALSSEAVLWLVVQTAQGGDEAVVLGWLDAGGRVNETFEYTFGDGSRSSGMTLLMVAMSCGHEGLAETLLQRGADVSLQTNNGETALRLAASNGREKLIELALRHGAEINQQTTLRRTALMDAAGYGHEKVVDALIRPARRGDRSAVQQRRHRTE